MSNWSSSDSEHSQKNKENQRSDQLPAIEANKEVPEMKQCGPPAVLTGEGAEKQIVEKGDKMIVEFVSGDNSDSDGSIGMSEDHVQNDGNEGDEKKEDTKELDAAEMVPVTQKESEKKEKKIMQKLRTVLRYFMGHGKEDLRRDTEKPASGYGMKAVQGEDAYSQQSDVLSSEVLEAEEKRKKGIAVEMSDWDSDDEDSWSDNEEHQQPKTRWCCWKKQRGASTNERPYEQKVMSEVTTKKTIEKQPEKEEEDEKKRHYSVTGEKNRDEKFKESDSDADDEDSVPEYSEYEDSDDENSEYEDSDDENEMIRMKLMRMELRMKIMRMRMKMMRMRMKMMRMRMMRMNMDGAEDDDDDVKKGDGNEEREEKVEELQQSRDIDSGTPTAPPKSPRQHAQQFPLAHVDSDLIDMEELSPRGALEKDDESIGFEELGETLRDMTLMMKEEEKGPATSP